MPNLIRNSVLCAVAGAMAASSPAMAQEEVSIASPDSNAMTVADHWQVLRVTPPPIVNSIIVNAPVDEAWALWTDEKRMLEFMGFDANIEPEAGGAYQVIFVTNAETAIGRGNDGEIIAIEPKRMLSFTWMTPMHMSELTGNSTFVTLYFTPIDDGARTQVDLINVGYGLGKDWHDAYAYNLRGWDRVLAHFQYALEVGPIDWVARAKELRRNGTLPMWREYKRRELRGED